MAVRTVFFLDLFQMFSCPTYVNLSAHEKIHPDTFAMQMDELNETLQHAMNRNYGLFDNLMTNLTFQLWPVIFGTNYRRVCILELMTSV